MKIVILLAGRGCRLGQITDEKHKSLIKLGNTTLLQELIKNINISGIKNIIPVLGYQSDLVLKEIENTCFDFKITPYYNKEYLTTNNLYSLYCTREMLEKEDFFLINGDMVFDSRILEKMTKSSKSQIAIDNLNKNKMLDYLRTKINNNRFIDINFNIPLRENSGYAIGLYHFSSSLSAKYFKKAEMVLKENPKHNFPELIKYFFEDEVIIPCNCDEYLYTDVDEIQDIDKALNILNNLEQSFNKI